jgi:hypothetical protein
MRLDDIRESSNVEDRRGGGGGMVRKGGLGMGTIAILGIIAYALGIDPRLLIGGAEMMGGGRSAAPTQTSQPVNDEAARFLRKVVALNEDVWGRVMPEQENRKFNPPGLVIFTGATQSACGGAQSAMGPHYCPIDRKVYLDTAFFAEMQRKLGGGGDFAYAYVIAHEVGHHIQNEVGLLAKVQQLQRQTDKVEGNQMQVRVELQADCLAGVWAHHAEQRYRVLQEGDVEEAMKTAAAIGDDNLQKRSQGYVVPESFTHGSSQQRMQWFMTGLKSGQTRACNTFQG